MEEIQLLVYQDIAKLLIWRYFLLKKKGASPFFSLNVDFLSTSDNDSPQHRRFNDPCDPKVLRSFRPYLLWRFPSTREPAIERERRDEERETSHKSFLLPISSYN